MFATKAADINNINENVDIMNDNPKNDYSEDDSNQPTKYWPFLGSTMTWPSFGQ